MFKSKTKTEYLFLIYKKILILFLFSSPFSQGIFPKNDREKSGNIYFFVLLIMQQILNVKIVSHAIFFMHTQKDSYSFEIHI